MRASKGAPGRIRRGGHVPYQEFGPPSDAARMLPQGEVEDLSTGHIHQPRRTLGREREAASAEAELGLTPEERATKAREERQRAIEFEEEERIERERVREKRREEKRLAILERERMMNAAADRWNQKMEGRTSPPLIAVAAADVEVRRESLDDRIARELEEFRQPGGTLPQQEEHQTAAADETPLREVHPLPPVPRRLTDKRRRSEGNVACGPTEVEFALPEQQSWEAEQELREYLQGNSHAASPVLQPPTAWLPVPSAGCELPPMDWDSEDVGSEEESLGVPTIVINTMEAPTVPGSRNKRKRAHPYNPSRHLEVDDYVAAHLRTPPRSPTPPSKPIRRPLSPRSRVRELDRQRREGNRELEREEASRVERESETPRGRDRETQNRERVRKRNGVTPVT